MVQNLLSIHLEGLLRLYLALLLAPAMDLVTSHVTSHVMHPETYPGTYPGTYPAMDLMKVEGEVSQAEVNPPRCEMRHH